MAYTLTYVLWSATFLALSASALPQHGLRGVAGAYLLAQIVSAAAVYLCAKHYFSFTLAGPALRTLSVGMFAVAVAAWALSQPADWPWRYAKGATVLLLWLALAWTEPRLRLEPD